ncbi:helix-turn-helix domain-containing protein [Bacillus sp. FJAT-50079]|uniref:winged helix-turn-helix transcriptional regulator n=1 Tax=Bacillus sp. FJAT-50079 TaxID=2833577 RepID=UPI001BC90582|nr:helix-turn-helix transcriptional regulator [Bacillus sp. FJAT-50079]
MQICPFLEGSFQILGRKWNGLIIHYLSLCNDYTAHFSDIQKDLKDITPRALSMKLSELGEYGLVEKKITGTTTVIISYELTEKGRSLAKALQPIQKWAQQYQQIKE